MDGGGSYADKVRNREASRYDPMLEEARCSIHGGDGVRQEDAEVALKAVHSGSDTSSGTPHPVKATPGEQLPAGYSRSYAGFLLRDEKRVIEVNQEIIKHKMEYLTEFTVIACFVEGRPPNHEMQLWLNQLQQKVGGSLTLGRNLGKGFFLIKSDDQDSIQKLLLATPYRGHRGLCIFQRWIAEFDPMTPSSGKGFGPHLPTNMKIPTERGSRLSKYRRSSKQWH